MNTYHDVKGLFSGSTTKPQEQPEDLFDPAIHLHYVCPQKHFTMRELLLPQSETASPIAGTVPFPLLSAQGVRAYRRAMFHPEVLNHCASSPFPGTLVLRNAVQHSKFIRDFWTHPETLSAVSRAAGLPLEVIMPTEIGHTNIQVDGLTISEMKSNLQFEPSNQKIELSLEDRMYDPLKDDTAIIPWHYDSYPYVCVLMLSETDGMIGGETYIKRGDGTAQRIEGPQIGHAVVLQGGEVEHLAARAKGVKERISTITSYRSKVPATYDSSFMTNIRPYADLDALYPEWIKYRLQKSKDEISHFIKRIEEQPKLASDRQGLDDLISKQIAYLQHTSRQIVEPELESQIVQKFGRSTYYAAPVIWKKAQKLPEFETLATLADDNRTWRSDSAYWMDLQVSIEFIRLNKPLKGALGCQSWKGGRYYMGDELIRQGLNEMFLEWLEDSGLWKILNQTDLVR
ncbi:hypothetical protein N7462_001685 [Penicillium macrosclerotiorum]|uniref:uncharacterized protein n=1 Tax=Penicillium macrosclerotiorum TaxID=303699 RepID=UPI0025493139|nr:uncharacterized protein N7462_001685 [Penicillium macrosclerotiorum]KAJ5692262.1 hypothetical protein N7462_001685 [Penicillium macrosclerotiorum]